MDDDLSDEDVDRLWHDPQILFEARLKIPKARAKEYPFSIPSVRKTTKIAMHPRVTFLVGEDGAGKSTWIEAIAIAFGFRPEGGTLGAKSGSYPAHSSLHAQLELIRTRRIQKEGFFLRAESFFNWASVIDTAQGNWSGYGQSPYEAYGGMSLHEQSHGESFLALIDNRLRPPGLYVFDEPEAALSPQRQLTFLSRLHGLVKQGGQFVIATHSPIILGYPDAWIYELSEHGVERKAYEDLDHYQVTRNFLNRRQTFLDILLEDEK